MERSGVADKSQETKVVGISKDFADYEELVSRFVGLANHMKDEGKTPPTINAALMLASGLYATYMAVGNEGQLDAKGVKEVAEVYRKNLSSVQRLKQRAALQQRKAD
jgi:hypothetical protein